MRTENREITVADEDQGLRLDMYLKKRFMRFSRNEWQQRIAEGAITINGHTGRASRKVNAGDVLRFSYTMRDEPEVPTDITDIYEDDDYLVVNKPPGLPVHPSGIYKTQTVTTLLKERGRLTDGYLLHRLDRETSGVLALAKNRRAATAFQKILRAGRIEKIYQVAIDGIVNHEIDATGVIYRLPESRLPRKRFFAATKDGFPPVLPATAMEIQSCRTVFTPIMSHEGLSLLKARLYTGRMHQIRATLASLGFPVIGDKLYGRDEGFYFRFADGELTEEDWKELKLSHSALHCYQMILAHPLRGGDWSLEAPLPSDIMSLFKPTER